MKMRNLLLLFVVFIIGIVVSYFFFDKPLAIYFFDSSFFRPICYFVDLILNPTLQVLIWPIIYFFVRFVFKISSGGSQFLLIAIAVNISNFISIPLKMLFGRYRPEALFTEHLYGFHFFALKNFEYSFPSGHAVTMGAIMGALACLYPRYSSLFILGSFVIAFCRVIATQHYLSDIIFGILIGLGIAAWVYSKMKQQITFKSHIR